MTWSNLRARWPAGAAGAALVLLLAAGIGLRVLADFSLWPTTTTLDDGYQLFAATSPFDDSQHPAGYGLILATIGAVTREVAVPVLVQHSIGIVSALLLWAATRRLSGSDWAGLLPASVILLNADQIFLEQAIMSESWAVLVTSGGLYAAARMIDRPEPWWCWPTLTGVLLGAAVSIRTAALLVIPVVLAAVVWSRPHPLRSLRRQWRPPVVLMLAAGIVLIAFAAANASFGERFGLGPSNGWYLYGRVAQFADCARFAPPPGTQVLCDTRPADERPGASWFLFNPAAPAPSKIGPFGTNDDLVGEWAGRALRAQPGDFATLAIKYLGGYWAPSLRPEREDSGVGLDPQLDFNFGNPFFEPTIQANLEAYYDDFTPRRRRGGLELLSGYQNVGRFGGTALSIATLLTLLGLAVGTRRSRCGVLLMGVGGLALILAPALTGNYVGRYVVPMAGPLAAASAITLTELSRRTRRRWRDSAKAKAVVRPPAAQVPPS